MISSPIIRFTLAAAVLGAAFLAARNNNLPEQVEVSVSATPTEIKGNTPTHQALNKAVAAAKQAPNKPESWSAMGDCYAQLQRDTQEEKFYNFAETAFQEALRLNEKHLPSLAGMAWVTGGRHQFDQSKSWAAKALAVDKECVDAYGIRGDAELELGEYDAAFDSYQQMMDLRPDLSSWSRGAHLLWITGDKSKALWLMTKAVNAGGPYAENTAWCRARLANMLLMDGALLPAENALRPAIEAGSTNKHILLAGAKLAIAKQDFAKANSYYQSILASGPNLEALAGIGDILTHQGKPDEAEAWYQKVESLHKSNLDSGSHDHGFMAKFYADHDRNLVEALRMAEEHKLTRNVTEADSLAWVYFKNKDLPKAIAAIKIALKQKTPDPEIHYHAGMIAAEFGDLGSARRHLQQALDTNGGFSLLQAPIARKTLESLASTNSVSQLSE